MEPLHRDWPGVTTLHSVWATSVGVAWSDDATSLNISQKKPPEHDGNTDVASCSERSTGRKGEGE
jgi:hypothetical protein